MMPTPRRSQRHVGGEENPGKAPKIWMKQSETNVKIAVLSPL
jgi:hypothetical protein